MSKSPEEVEATMIENLEVKTGRDLDEWLRLARSSGFAKHGELVRHLKEEHGIGHGYANLVAHRFFSGDPATHSEAALVEAQYGGPKAALRPLYHRLATAVQGLGEDVVVSPKKTYVSFRRRKQFALAQPSTATRLDVGINLPGVSPRGRLEASASFNAMVSHRVRVAGMGEIDQELLAWLRTAYERA